MSLHFNESVYRERLLEHLLVGELLKHSNLRVVPMSKFRHVTGIAELYRELFGSAIQEQPPAPLEF
jgi:hypothetical protein